MNKKKFTITFFLLFVFLCGYFFNSTRTMAKNEEENIENYQVNQEDIDMIINYNEEDMINRNSGVIADINELVLAMEEEEEEEKNLSYNVYQKTNLSAEELNEILANTALAGHGESFVELEDKYNLNGIFAIAVSIEESGWSGRQANKNNYYGMKGSNGYLSFASAKENILYFGEMMTNTLYKGKSLKRIAKIYCPPRHKKWHSDVIWLMGKLMENVK